MRIGEGVCSLSPAAFMLDLAPSLTFEELLGLAEELCGCWSLPDCRLEPDEIEESLDFLGKPCGYFECKPALTIEELEEYRAGVARVHGRNAAETVARMMYKRAGRYFRPRAASYRERRVTLLAELRKALGLDREMEPARLRIGEQMTNFQDM